MMRACMLSHFSHVQLCAPLWTVACQAPLSVGFSRQEYWSGLPCSLPGYLPHPGSEPMSLMSPALAGRFFTTSATWEALASWNYSLSSFLPFSLFLSFLSLSLPLPHSFLPSSLCFSCSLSFWNTLMLSSLILLFLGILFTTDKYFIEMKALPLS